MMHNSCIHRLAYNLRRVRKSKHLMTKELAHDVGVSPQLISQVERGKHFVHFSTLDAIADALNVDISELFKRGPDEYC